MAEVVGAVDQQVGVVLLGHSLVVDEVGRVRVHGEESLGHDEDGVVGVGLPGFPEHPLHFVLVQVFEALDLFGGGDGAFLEAVVADVVHDDVVLGPHQRVDDSEASHPPRRKNQNIHVPILGQLILQL